MNTQETVAEKLVRLRGNRRRADVAEEVGISVSALAMYEAGKRIPRDEIKVSLAHTYGTNVGDLFFSQSRTNSADNQ